MNFEEWIAWRSMIRGDLLPLAELLLTSGQPLAPQIRRELAAMIAHDMSAEYVVTTKLRSGVAFNGTHRAKMDRHAEYMRFAIAVIGHGGLRRGELARARFEAMKEFPDLTEETAKTHWKRGRKDALLWLSTHESEKEAP